MSSNHADLVCFQIATKSSDMWVDYTLKVRNVEWLGPVAKRELVDMMRQVAAKIEAGEYGDVAPVEVADERGERALELLRQIRQELLEADNGAPDLSTRTILAINRMAVDEGWDRELEPNANAS